LIRVLISVIIIAFMLLADVVLECKDHANPGVSGIFA